MSTDNTKKKPSDMTIDEMVANRKKDPPKEEKPIDKKNVCVPLEEPETPTTEGMHGATTVDIRTHSGGAGYPPRETTGESTPSVTIGDVPKVDPPKETITAKVKAKVQTILAKDEMIVIRCNICEKDFLLGRKNKDGSLKPEAQCMHFTFKGLHKE